MDFLVVGVETVGEALSKKDAYVYLPSEAVGGLIDPATEDEANRLLIVLQVLLNLPLGDDLDEAFLLIRRVQFDISPHGLQDLIPLLAHHDVDIQFLRYILQHLFLSVIIQSYVNPRMYV